MKLVSLVRHKNGLKYLPKLVPQLVSISDAVVFLDDHSTDGSNEELLRLKNVHKEFYVVRREHGDWSGGLDWNALFRFAERFDPQWLLTLDVDELIEESEAYRIRELAEQAGQDILGWAFPFYYLWDDEKHYRDDGKYSNTRVIRLIRYNKTYPPPDRATHATAVSDYLDRRMLRLADVRIWHFGYLDKKDRESKHNFYISRDADPEAAHSGGQNYDHMINTPASLPTVPSLTEWKSNPTIGDCLKASPKRVCIGGFFPLSQDKELKDLDTIPSDSVDELRISYIFDSMSVSDIKLTLDKIMRVLRPGGRIEAVGNDFDGMCKAFSEGDHDVKVSLQNRMLWTPHKKPVRICLCHSILGGLMQHHQFENVQSVPLSGHPYRLYTIGFKKGNPIW